MVLTIMRDECTYTSVRIQPCSGEPWKPIGQPVHVFFCRIEAAMGHIRWFRSLDWVYLLNTRNTLCKESVYSLAPMCPLLAKFEQLEKFKYISVATLVENFQNLILRGKPRNQMNLCSECSFYLFLFNSYSILFLII